MVAHEVRVMTRDRDRVEVTTEGLSLSGGKEAHINSKKIVGHADLVKKKRKICIRPFLRKIELLCKYTGYSQC